MWSRKKRLLVLGLAAVGVGLGAGLEPLLDPFEGTGYAALGLLLSMLAFGAVGGLFLSRGFDEAGEIDERAQAIERRASRYSHGTLITGVGVVALVVTSLPWANVPVGVVLWTLLIGSVVIHEGSIEYYRRRM